MTTKNKEIWLAGGCFWGTEHYIRQIYGVVSTDVGYANGATPNPTYEEVCSKDTGHAETVHIAYDPNKISLGFLLRLYFDSIDPLAKDRQGNDIGAQYRTGIYYKDINDLPIIKNELSSLSNKIGQPLAIEVKPLENYYKAEDYHQNYLIKNQGGYCHIPPALFEHAKHAREYQKPDKDTIKKKLNHLQYDVTQNNATEPPFDNEYNDFYKPGIYVDIVTGEPLFTSTDKFESSCGWPAFSKPIKNDLIIKNNDNSFGMRRIEVKSKIGDSHLGHVFDDGPNEKGGLRYCINSASLKFIPKEEMKEKGYGEFLHLIK